MKPASWEFCCQMVKVNVFFVILKHCQREFSVISFQFYIVHGSKCPRNRNKICKKKVNVIRYLRCLNNSIFTHKLNGNLCLKYHFTKITDLLVRKKIPKEKKNYLDQLFLWRVQWNCSVRLTVRKCFVYNKLKRYRQSFVYNY